MCSAHTTTLYMHMYSTHLGDRQRGGADSLLITGTDSLTFFLAAAVRYGEETHESGQMRNINEKSLSQPQMTTSCTTIQ